MTNPKELLPCPICKVAMQLIYGDAIAYHPETTNCPLDNIRFSANDKKRFNMWNTRPQPEAQGKEIYRWRVSDVFDDGHNGILTCHNEPTTEYGLDADSRIVIGAASPLTREQAQKICDVHNWELEQVAKAQPQKLEKLDEKEFCEMLIKECSIARKEFAMIITKRFCQRFGKPSEVSLEWPKYKTADGFIRQPKCAASWNLAIDACKSAYLKAREKESA